MDTSPPSAERQIARAASVVMAAFVLSSLMGLARQVLVSRAFGTRAELDAFYAAQGLPDILFNLVAGGALASAFIPVLTGFLIRGDRAGAWRLASAINNLVFLILSLLSALCALAAPWLVGHVLAPSFGPAQAALAVSLLRVLLLSSVIFGVSGLLMGVLNAHQHFLLPALATSFYWLGWIIGVQFFAPRLGIHGLAWGVVLGAGLHLGVQLPGLWGRGARYSLSLGWDNPSVRQVARLMAPRLVGVAAVQVNFLVNRILAAGQPEGSLTAITVAFAIMTMPQVVIAQAIAIAALPTFSAQAARGDWQAVRASLATTLRGVLFLALPASLGLMLLRQPVVAMLLQRGTFDAHSTQLVAWGLLWYAAGLVGHSWVEIASRAFYALHDTRTPALVGAAAMALNVLLSLGFAAFFMRLGWMPHGGLALANSLATALECAALLVLMHRRLSGLELARLRPGLLATVGGAAAMAAALAAWLSATAGLSAWTVGLGGVALGAAVYWLAALALGAPEARQLPRLLFKPQA